MSRIGRLPVVVPKDVNVSILDSLVTVKGKLGTLTQQIQNKNIEVAIVGNEVLVTRTNEIKETKAAHGLYRVLIQNMVTGVEKGYQKTLVINGVGYKVNKQGNKIVLNIGFSHPIEVVEPEGIEFQIVGTTEIVVKGINKDLVGQVSADIKSFRKPEPYHGYGIRYKDEIIVRKEGKTAGK